MKPLVFLLSIALLLSNCSRSDNKKPNAASFTGAKKEKTLDRKTGTPDLSRTEGKFKRIFILEDGDLSEIDFNDTENFDGDLPASIFKNPTENALVFAGNSHKAFIASELESDRDRLLVFDAELKPVESMLLKSSFGNADFQVTRTYRRDGNKLIVTDTRKDFNPDTQSFDTTYRYTYSVSLDQEGHIKTKRME